VLIDLLFPSVGRVAGKMQICRLKEPAATENAPAAKKLSRRRTVSPGKAIRETFCKFAEGNVRGLALLHGQRHVV
jgi:hypothetical protein